MSMTHIAPRVLQLCEEPFLLLFGTREFQCDALNPTKPR
jgi:hypothetical protein